MKTATVRDLRNRFADVAKLIEEGESVAITRRGETFATLSPMTSERTCCGQLEEAFGLGSGNRTKGDQGSN